jgi:hypothetical protein
LRFPGIGAFGDIECEGIVGRRFRGASETGGGTYFAVVPLPIVVVEEEEEEGLAMGLTTFGGAETVGTGVGTEGTEGFTIFEEFRILYQDDSFDNSSTETKDIFSRRKRKSKYLS